MAASGSGWIIAVVTFPMQLGVSRVSDPVVFGASETRPTVRSESRRYGMHGTNAVAADGVHGYYRNLRDRYSNAKIAGPKVADSANQLLEKK